MDEISIYIISVIHYSLPQSKNSYNVAMCLHVYTFIENTEYSDTIIIFFPKLRNLMNFSSLRGLILTQFMWLFDNLSSLTFLKLN